MEYKDVNQNNDVEAGFYFELHFNYYNEKSEKDMAEDTGRPVL